jgi:hypothetical protein
VFADSKQTSSLFYHSPFKLKGPSFTVLLKFDSHMELWNRTKQRDILHRHVCSDPIPLLQK